MIEAVHKATRKARAGTDCRDLTDGHRALEVVRAA
jgi:hypothetical protein